MTDLPELTPGDREVYAWQLDLPGFGEAGQRRLRASTALVTRVGGLGGPLAFALAAAGIGRLLLAHGGELRPDDLNRQILMRHAALGSGRAVCAQQTLAAFNPDITVEAIPENVGPHNADALVQRADIVFDAAPLFEERLALNAACVRAGKPLIDCAMYGMEGQVIPIVPGSTPCLACLYPEVPAHWERRFPVLGAVSALVANVGALEGIKLLTGLGTVARGQMIFIDTTTMDLRKITLLRRADCVVCGDGRREEQ